jgi:hypothetical protein
MQEDYSWEVVTKAGEEEYIQKLDEVIPPETSTRMTKK